VAVEVCGCNKIDILLLLCERGVIRIMGGPMGGNGVELEWTILTSNANN